MKKVILIAILCFGLQSFNKYAVENRQINSFEVVAEKLDIKIKNDTDN